MNKKTQTDVLIIGAGAAGLFCGALAAAQGVRSLVIDHSLKPAEKVRISGGGRCNFTNIYCAPDRFISSNPHFAKSALARFTPDDFLTLMRKHDLTWHEKTMGQLFCDQKSGAVIQLLLDELKSANGAVELGVSVEDIAHKGGGFRAKTSLGEINTRDLVIATGGLSIPKMGATGFAYEVARQFGHGVIEPRAGLVPLVFSGALKEQFAGLSGVSAPVRVGVGAGSFSEAMLFTHRGLSGPAVLQASSYWREGNEIEVDLFDGNDGQSALTKAREEAPKQTLFNAIERIAPKRLAPVLVECDVVSKELATERLADLSNEKLKRAAEGMSAWRLKPAGTEGWRTAEVTVGGVDTDSLSSKTMESKSVPGLYFIGECVDVTGWLGGYNFQWAWASAHAAANAIALKTNS